jgi:hypothetical protein
MTIDPNRNISNQNSNSKRKQNTLVEDHLTKTNKPNEREYGLLDDKIILPEDFAEFDLEIEKLFYGEN